MTKVVSGLIRRAPYVKQGAGTNGPWKMYAIDLSESFMPRKKPNSNEKPVRVYTNYRAVLFASSQGMIGFYDKIFQEGNFVVLECDKLEVNIQDGDNGRQFVKLEMVEAKFVDGHNIYDDQAGSSGASQQQAKNSTGTGNNAGNSSGWGNPSGGASGAASAGEDDDIPF